jgi:hypothetical protein
VPDPFLDDARREFRRLESLGNAAMAQLDDRAFFRTLGDEENSVAIIVKHMAGNMRSRWRDFLTTDGEKPDRDRDTEFVITDEDTRPGLIRRWEAGWTQLFDAMDPLGDPDLTRIVVIRGEAHTVLQAINRQLSHYAYHTGQIVLLARHLVGPGWQTPSVARGGSRAFNSSPTPYLDDETA